MMASHTPHSPILECQALHFAYPGGQQALNGLEIQFERGLRHVVLGPNGAGKSTLFMLLNGVLKPSKGHIFFEGEPLCHDRAGLRRVRSRVGVLFQDPDAQLLSFSVREDISFGPMNLGLKKPEIELRVEKAIEDCALEQLADRPVHALSYGEKKRVGLAGLLAMSPDVLILDEPTAGLDRKGRQIFMALLEALNQKGLTLILSTHSTDLAYAWADQAYVLQQGQRVAQAAKSEFPKAFRDFEAYGLSVPRCLELAECLMEKGLLKDWPKSDEDLLSMLKPIIKVEHHR